MLVNRIPFALGAITLGVVTLVFRDFLLQWQPVPADVPQREVLAIISGVILCFARTLRLAAIVLAVDYVLWVVVLHGAAVIKAPASVVAWLGVAEILALTVGAALLVLPDRARVLRIVIGLCAIVFGISHFVYAEFTAQMVPAFMPFPLFWAYATGAGHLAAGVSFIVGILDRLAATLFTFMLASFVLLLHVPRVIAAPGNRVEWTMLGIALSLTGAAWLARMSIPPTGARSAVS
jgi:uncharacterized membrane protein